MALCAWLPEDHALIAPWYDIDTACIPAHQQPAVLVDMGLQRGLDSHKLLRGTAVFYEDILAGDLLLTPRQCYALINNSRRLIGGHDLSFLLGHRLFPGSFGAAGSALLNARDVQQAAEILARYRAVFSPLIAPRLHYDADYLYIYWQDACGSGAQNVFLTEMISTAFTALCRWLGNRLYAWQYYFSHPRPTYVEQYQVHLGEQVHFGSHVDAMVIARRELHMPWASASPSAQVVAQREADAQLQALPAARGLLDALYDHLLANVQQEPNLEQTAADFGMSSATFKRKLRTHGTHFQAEYDKVRKQLAIYLLNRQGWSCDDVAAHLNFHDSNNLRRAFKRWTGLTPAAIEAFSPAR